MRLVQLIIVALGGVFVSMAGDNPIAHVHPNGYVAYRAEKPLNIDGELTEASWNAVPWTSSFVDIEGDLRPRPRFRTRAKMLWDDSYLYIGAELEEPQVCATLTQRDTVIFYDNDFEVFIDPNGDNHEYYEFEMNALNTVWDLFLTKPYKDSGQAIDSWNIEGLKTAVHVSGTINNPGDIDSGWSVEIAMPWAALKEYAHRPAPPLEGDQWRINFSRVEWLHKVVGGMYQKIKGSHEDNWVWSPQGVVDMHRPERWGYLQFSTQRPGQTQFQTDPTWEVRVLLHSIYYAQRAFRETNKRWASSLDELNFRPESAGWKGPLPLLRSTDGGFVVTINIQMPNGSIVAWHIRQDALLWHE